MTTNNIHIGPIRIFDSSVVYLLAKVTYWLTMSHVKQSVIVFTVVSIALGFLLAGTSAAQAYQARDFFNFEAAKTMWKTATYEDMDRALKACPKAYKPWLVQWKRDSAGALAALKDNPKAAAIKTCFDVWLTARQWTKAYGTWRGPLEPFGSPGWNKTPPNLLCLSMRTSNIFTGSCNDLPDWRNPANKAQDNAWIARHNRRVREEQ